MIFWYPYGSTSMEWGLRRVVPAAAVTTHAEPRARQQLALDKEVERAQMGQRCRPHRFRRGTARQFFSHVDSWISAQLQLSRCTATKKHSPSLACPQIQRWFGYMKTFFTFRTEGYFDTRTAVQAWSGVSAAWCPQRESLLMPSRTHGSNLHLI